MFMAIILSSAFSLHIIYKGTKIQYLNVSIIKCVKTKLLINFFIICNYTFTERPKLGLADGMYTTQHYFYCLEQDCQGKLSEIGAKKNLRIMYHTVNKISLFSVV